MDLTLRAGTRAKERTRSAQRLRVTWRCPSTSTSWEFQHRRSASRRQSHEGWWLWCNMRGLCSLRLQSRTRVVMRNSVINGLGSMSSCCRFFAADAVIPKSPAVQVHAGQIRVGPRAATTGLPSIVEHCGAEQPDRRPKLA